MSEKQSTKPPAGTRDFLPDEIRRRQYVIGIIRDVYEKYGFEPLETPAFENIETLLGKYGDEGNKLIFKILKRGEHEQTGEADLALRYDLTVPLARVVAQYQNEIPKFFKRYQIQPVWRADRPAKGRFREFYQCDIDALGSTSPIVEAELLSAIADVLARLGFQDFQIRVNDRSLLTWIIDMIFGVSETRHAEALIVLDKLDKITQEAFAREMDQRGLTDPNRALEALKSLGIEPARPDTPEESWRTFDQLEDLIRRWVVLAPQRVDSLRGYENLRQIRDLCLGSTAHSHLRFDPSLARGLSYYTGAIMEVAVPDVAGSLGGGGRYDNLVGMFLGRDVPACGFSLGLERIIVVMTERNMFPLAVAAGGVDVLVTMWEVMDLRVDALALAADLRRSGLSVDVYPEPDKLGKQFRYASERHARFVAVRGSDERAADTVNLKNLATGEQVTVARVAVAAFIARTLNRDLEP